MPLSEFLRQRLQAYSDNTVPALIITGGSVFVGWLIQNYGPVWGLDPKAAIVLAWVVALAVALALSLLLKPKSKPKPEPLPEERPTLTLPQIIVSPTISPVFNNSPQIDQRPINYQTQGQSQHQGQSIESLPRDPVFEYTGEARLPLYGIDRRTRQIIREGPTSDEISQIPDYITVAHAILIPFYYRPDRYVDHTVYLSAHVSVYLPDKKTRLKRVIGGIWDGNPLKSSSRIQTGHTLALMAAFAPIATEGILSAEYHQEIEESYMGKTVYDAPRLEVIKGTSFSLFVELLPKRMSKDPFPIQPFWFNLELVTGVIAPPKLIVAEPPT